MLVDGFDAFRRGEIAALAGLALLIVVALVRAPVLGTSNPEPQRRLVLVPLGVFALAVLLGSQFVERVVRFEGLVPRNSEMSARLRHGISRIAANSKRPAKNVLLVGGGSYVSFGLDSGLLSDLLRKRGYEALVVNLAAPGANHLERRQLFEDLRRHPKSQLKATADKSHLVLLEEVQSSYDRHPLAQAGANLSTARLYHYLTPRAAISALRALHFGGGAQDETPISEWALFNHALVRAFNAGAVDLLSALKRVPSESGFAPFRTATFAFPGTKRAARATQGVAPKRSLPRWLRTQREPALRAALGGLLDDWVYFSVPSTYRGYIQHNRVFCRGTRRKCISLDDPKLLRSLNARKYWHDPGHLSWLGARTYTRWLANELVRAKVLKK